MIKREKLRRILLFSTAGLFVAAAIVVGISYQVLAHLTFAGDRVIYGKRLSELTHEIRAELVKRPNLQAIRIPTTDNLTLAGFLVTQPQPTANIVLCHGYRSAKELLYAMLDIFPTWNTLMFDFRAHGDSDGTITSIGFHEHQDVISTVQFMRATALKNGTSHLPLIVLGISMGGAATLKATEMSPDLCNAIIVDSTYSRLSSTIFKAFSTKTHLPLYPFFPVIKYLFHALAGFDVHAMNPEECMAKIKQPVLIIHAVDDSYVSPRNALRLLASARNQHSKLWIAPSCRHAWLHSYYPELYHAKVMSFLRKAKILPAQ